MTISEYLRAASEEARREHPERLTDEDLAQFWNEYDGGSYPVWSGVVLFAELMHCREDLKHVCEQLALQGRLIEGRVWCREDGSDED